MGEMEADDPLWRPLKAAAERRRRNCGVVVHIATAW